MGIENRKTKTTIYILSILFELKEKNTFLFTRLPQKSLRKHIFDQIRDYLLDLSPPSEQFSKKQEGIFLAFFKFPIEKKGIFKENQKNFSTSFFKRGDKYDDNL